jgi:hypothetical protein
LRERQISEFVEDDEIKPGQAIGGASLPPLAGLGFETVRSGRSLPPNQRAKRFTAQYRRIRRVA